MWRVEQINFIHVLRLFRLIRNGYCTTITAATIHVDLQTQVAMSHHNRWFTANVRPSDLVTFTIHRIASDSLTYHSVLLLSFRLVQSRSFIV